MSAPLTIFKNLSKAGLELRIDEYFKKVKRKGLSASLTGLALHLGCTRKNIIDYRETDEFYEVLTRAKLRCENVLEERMIAGAPPTGMIFILKNNYGWSDKVEIDQTIKGNISLSSLFTQAAQQKALEGRKEEIVEGEIIETETKDLLFDSHEESELTNEEITTSSTELDDELF